MPGSGPSTVDAVARSHATVEDRVGTDEAAGMHNPPNYRAGSAEAAAETRVDLPGSPSPGGRAGGGCRRGVEGRGKHQQLGTNIAWCRDNLNVHLVQELYDFAEANKGWLRVFQSPATNPS